MLGLKDNQPTLTEAAERLLAKAPVVHETHDKGHGRTEHRYLRVAKVSAALAAQLGFPSASQFIAVDRERGDLADRMTSMETSYYVTDLREDQASPAKLACYFRGHWGIENRRSLRARPDLRRGPLPGTCRRRSPGPRDAPQPRDLDPSPQRVQEHRRRSSLGRLGPQPGSRSHGRVAPTTSSPCSCNATVRSAFRHHPRARDRTSTSPCAPAERQDDLSVAEARLLLASSSCIRRSGSCATLPRTLGPAQRQPNNASKDWETELYKSTSQGA